MAVPTVVSVGAGNTGTGNVTYALPATWAVGDLFYLFIETAAQTVSAPSGWTEIANSPQSIGTSTTATQINVFRRIAESGDTAPTVTDPGDHQDGLIIAFRGQDATPENITGGNTTSTNVTGTLTGVTTTVDDCLIVVVGTCMTDSTDQFTCAVTNGTLTSLTQRFVSNTVAGNGGGVAVNTGIKATAGATGNTTFAWSDEVPLPVATQHAMMVIAIAPTATASVVKVKTVFIC